MASFTSDGGQTWSSAVPISQPTTRTQLGCDVEVGPGGIVYAVWGNFAPPTAFEDSLGFANLQTVELHGHFQQILPLILMVFLHRTCSMG